MNRKSLDSIDLAKFISSVLIFSMHMCALSDFEKANFVLELLSRWGVPFFFISSAYFLYKKIYGEKQATKDYTYKYISRIAFLYAAWFVFNLPYIIYRYFSFSYANLFKFIKSAFLSSTFTGSWFLVSCIFSAWFVFVVCRKLSTSKTLGISLLLYIPCIFSSVYGGLLPRQISFALSFLCFPLNIFNGCIFFALGKLVVENEVAIKSRFHQKKCLFLCFIFYLTYIIEVFTSKYFSIYQSSDVSFSVVPVALFLFILLMQSNIVIKSHLTLRRLSTIIYVSQANILILSVC